MPLTLTPTAICEHGVLYGGLLLGLSYYLLIRKACEMVLIICNRLGSSRPIGVSQRYASTPRRPLMGTLREENVVCSVYWRTERI